MRRALVTGATSGLGLALTGALIQEGYRVRASGRDVAVGRTLSAFGAAFEAGDLSTPGVAERLTEGIDVVFHAAALSGPWGSAELFRAANVDATRTLLAAARLGGAEGFVYVSTPSIYAEPRDRLALTEQSPLPARFANAYAATKYEGERAVLATAGPDFAATAIRPRAIIGPGDRTLLPRLLRIARTGRFPLFRGGKALIEITDTRDAARAMVLADQAGARASGKAYNIAGGEPVAACILLEEVFTAMGLSPRLSPIPYPLASALAGLSEVVCAVLPGRPEPPATRYSIGTLAFSQTFDTAAARRDLGWAPQHTRHETIERTARAWRDHAAV